MVAPSEKLRNLIDVIKWCQVNGLPADVVGRWVWLKFDAKPDEDTRNALKAAGFKWVQRRKEWAHNCGHPSRHGKGNPRFKYGQVAVGEFSDSDLAGV